MVEKAGPDADVKIGSSAAVFPWIGCGECAACKAGEENLCAAPRHLGIQVDGGFATHVLVPHPRYLIDHGAAAGLARRRLHVLGADRILGAQADRPSTPSAARCCWSGSAASA